MVLILLKIMDDVFFICITVALRITPLGGEREVGIEPMLILVSMGACGAKYLSERGKNNSSLTINALTSAL